MDMDIPERLKRVRRAERDGVNWIHAQDYLRAIRAPTMQERRIKSGIPQHEKIMLRERRGSMRGEEVRVMYITPEAAKAIAVDYAQCPNAMVRAWADG